MQRRVTFRSATEITILGVVALIVWRTWYVEGLPVPVCVDGGSMAETLLGPHRRIVCGDCGFVFDCGADRPATDPRAVCPNCGYSGSDVREWPELTGDRVLVHRAMFQLRPPRRWEVVAFRTPGRESQVSTKRVVGLPGESVEIRDGDVYINGAIARKGLGQQRALSVLVHDARYAPRLSPGLPLRWRPDAKNSRWSNGGGRFVHPAESAQQEIDWLTYHHWRRVPGQPGKVEEGPVLTDTPYNQGHRGPAGSIRPTAELRLSFRLTGTSGAGWLWVRATDGQEVFLVRIDPAGCRLEAFHNARALELMEPSRSLTGQMPLEVDVSLIDQRFLVAIDRRTLVAFPYQRRHHLRGPTACPFALGVQGMGIELEALRVYRDVDYSSPNGTGRSILLRDCVEHRGEYFVIGDNASISDDSRTWSQGPGLAGDTLVGKPFLAGFRMEWARIGPWSFRIPDISAIRYIR